MRDAGKVAMTPRGIYNEETTYEYLDIVLYGMSSWVAKKVTTGNPPEEGEYWQKIAAGTEEIINDSIVSGGNAWSSLKTNNLYKEQGLDFIVSSTRENIQTGETHQSRLGKVKRWFSDLKTVAFSGNYNDLSNKPTLGNSASKAVANNVTTTGEGSVLDARQGKVLKDEINQLNSNITYHHVTNTSVEALIAQARTDGLTVFWGQNISGIDNITADDNDVIIEIYRYPVTEYASCRVIVRDFRSTVVKTISQINGVFSGWIDSNIAVKTYTNSYAPNGVTVTANIQGAVVGLKLRGSAVVGLNTGQGYATLGTITALGALIKGESIIINRTIIASGIYGQLRIEKGGVVRVGYTTNATGSSISIPEGTAFYKDTTFVLA